MAWNRLSFFPLRISQPPCRDSIYYLGLNHLYLALNISLLLTLLIYSLPLFAIILSLAFRSPPEFLHSVQLRGEASQTNTECPALLSTQALPK